MTGPSNQILIHSGIKKRLRISRFLLCSIITLLLSSCNISDITNNPSQNKTEFISKSGFLLNTQISIQLYDKREEAILEECFHIIEKYESIYSRTNEASELYSLNHKTAPMQGHSYQISEELSDIIEKGLYYCELSGGAFDITVAPITSLWDFTAPEPILPEEAKIQAALTNVNYKYLHLKDRILRFDKEDMGIDLGAIAKGYIADRLKEYLLSEGVKSAIINLGGNVLCVGEKPDGTPFRVGIQKPFANRNETAAILEIKNRSVVSSGIYERYFTIDGTIYHHILNPKTGYPFETNLVSVTIISNESTDGDGLSTTCFALGLENGLQLIESMPDTYAVFIDKDYNIYYSKGLKEAIPLLEN